MLIQAFPVLLKWSSIIGLLFDFTGACLVYIGVRTTILEAFKLERPVVPMTICDIGGDKIIDESRIAGINRAQERVRAKRWAFTGLLFFLFGFVLQAMGNWPK